MNCQTVKISIIIPFYKGNKFLLRLFTSIKNVADAMISDVIANKAEFEVIIVNDSPEVDIILPEIANGLDVKVYSNEYNVGIQKTRINGLKKCNGDWVLFLDQDDELVADGFEAQVDLTKKADVIVGNGLYQYGTKKILVYKNLCVMEYLIQKKRFIEIRNLIPSPGECLIRKNAVPKLWQEFPMKQSGADDWFLWIQLFQEGRIFKCNEKIVYIHNDAEGQNLSLDIEKMYVSSVEMLGILKGIQDNKNRLNDRELRDLEMAMQFKYRQDTSKLNICDCVKYKKCILDNVKYKLSVKLGEMR